MLSDSRPGRTGGKGRPVSCMRTAMLVDGKWTEDWQPVDDIIEQGFQQLIDNKSGR